MNRWEKISPPRYEETRDIYEKIIFDVESKKQINDLTEWRVENFCDKFIGDIIT